MGARFKMFWPLLMVVVFVTACDRDARDLRLWVAEESQRPGEPIDPIPPVETAEVVAYEADNLRDPFQRQAARAEDDVTDVGTGDGPRPDPDRRREFLEGFPLDTLAMVGTLRIDGVDYALIRDNENVVHRITEGNYLGRNHGLVERVTASRVELRELVQDGRGGWSERRVQIAMDEA
ncbi:pilus assembly protein PilP [Wenzhouxiangella limi]|uniref:Pilus assembly protein PilP n=1 Tax=Wenzhouxiangella limi TaxID=2707351 RepID=A0A845UX57_9GAMM|nr:pilus assembly protein PilP [Wenzhouxiangella limi]NDY96007.1 pilus assembly protein PilP [Wenzhouxiangella limi]